MTLRAIACPLLLGLSFSVQPERLPDLGKHFPED